VFTLLPLFDAFCLLSLVGAGLAIVMGSRAQGFFQALTAFAGSLLVAIAILGSVYPLFWHVVPPIGFATFPIHLRTDSLSSMFVLLLGVITLTISLFSGGYLKHLEGRINFSQYWVSLFLFLLSMTLVLVSADAITFMVFWEVMSLSSAALVACEHRQHRVQRAAVIYLVATRIATGFLAAGFLWMHSKTGSWLFADWNFGITSTWLPALLLLLAFAIKAGIWPFHIWLPYAHPAAPAPVSALMSGVMIKVALYGLLRLLVGGGLQCPPLAYLALFLGTVSSFWGVLFALVQHDLKKLLAYSSVENAGLIMMAIGLTLHAKALGLGEVAAVAIAASLFHIINHGLFKSLLFLGAGAVDAQAHSRDLIHLGGLSKRMPWTTMCFLLGSASICALPPLNGFASKWQMYQAFLLATFESNSMVDRAIAFAAIGVLAMVGGLAIAGFTKAFGVAFLGRPRSRSAEHASEVPISMVAAQAIPAVACIALGMAAPISLPVMNYAIAFVGLTLLIHAVVLAGSRVRHYSTWECGYGQIPARAQVSAESFTQPIARIFSPVLRYKLDVTIRGKDRRHFPEYVSIEPRMVSLLESRVYRPALYLIGAAGKAIAKLQAGSIHLYLLYVCITLIVVLVVGTKL
jgi:hydrogenase-4 component B